MLYKASIIRGIGNLDILYIYTGYNCLLYRESLKDFKKRPRLYHGILTAASTAAWLILAHMRRRRAAISAVAIDIILILKGLGGRLPIYYLPKGYNYNTEDLNAPYF